MKAATTIGFAAPQTSHVIIGFAASGPQDEDCLNLNVFTPACDNGKRPVMVWIHGGGFTHGAGYEPLYDGGSLAVRGNVVVVTINYRLGALSLLRLPEIGAHGNQALLDQVMALAWVRGKNDTDSRPLAQLPPLEGRLALAYATTDWSAGGLVRLVAAQDRFAINQGNIVGQDLGRSPGFAVLSLNASRRFGRDWRLSAGVDNLLDKTYAEHISRAGGMVSGFVQTTRVNEPGRTLWLKLDFSR